MYRALALLVAFALTGFCPGDVRAQLPDLDALLGNSTARQQACEDYQLPPDDTDISFLGPYQSIVVGSVNYTYHRFGPLDSDDISDNTSLVLIPGSGATSSIWQADFLRGLAQNREVITFDPRGYGSADSTPVSQLTIDSIAFSLVDFFNALGLDEPDVLGWSWGGTITLALGAFYGDSVGNLVVLSSTSGGEGLYPGLDYENITEGRQQGQGTPAAAIFPDTRKGNIGLCRFLAYTEIMPGPKFTAEQITSQAEYITSFYQGNDTLSEALLNIANPVLLGHGGLDIDLDVENAEYLFNNLTEVALFIGNDAGHAFLFQDVDAVLDEVTSFLDFFDPLESGDDDENDNDNDSAENSSSSNAYLSSLTN